MSIQTRKRRRSEAFEDDNSADHPPPEDHHEDGDSEIGEDNDDEAEAMAEDEESDAKARKEREIWDTFREEQYEVLEQLPLSLHRSFALMLELDQQVQGNEKKLVPTLQKYISVRKSLASGELVDKAQEQTTPQTGDGEIPAPDEQPNANDAFAHSADAQSAAQIRPDPVSPSETLESPSSRQLLAEVASMSEEIVRASNEKVSLARFAYNLVDRYIRDLDRAIKEQETSLSVGMRPGTHPASIILPEVVPPTTLRAPRVSHHPPPPPPPVSEPIAAPERTSTPEQPEPDADTEVEVVEDAEALDEDEPTLGIEANEPWTSRGDRATPVRPRRRRSAKWSRKKKPVIPPPGAAVADRADDAGPDAPTSLKLTVPPLSSITVQVGNTGGADGADASGTPIDPDEPRYCYCNQVSFGTMVACDNDSCEREWFHLACVGLNQAPAPRQKWYCRDCTELMGKRKKGR